MGFKQMRFSPFNGRVKGYVSEPGHLSKRHWKGTPECLSSWCTSVCPCAWPQPFSCCSLCVDTALLLVTAESAESFYVPGTVLVAFHTLTLSYRHESPVRRLLVTACLLPVRLRAARAFVRSDGAQALTQGHRSPRLKPWAAVLQ